MTSSHASGEFTSWKAWGCAALYEALQHSNVACNEAGESSLCPGDNLVLSPQRSSEHTDTKTARFRAAILAYIDSVLVLGITNDGCEIAHRHVFPHVNDLILPD